MSDLDRLRLETERDTLLAAVQTLYAGERALRVHLARVLDRPDAAGRWSRIIRAAGEQRTQLTQALERLQRSA